MPAQRRKAPVGAFRRGLVELVTLDLNCLRCHRLGHDPARGQEDAHHLARILEAIGHDGIENRVATDYDKWVKEKGNMFRLRDGVDGHRGTLKLRWEMLLASVGEVISIGLDFLVLGGDGRIRTGYRFIEA